LRYVFLPLGMHPQVLEGHVESVATRCLRLVEQRHSRLCRSSPRFAPITRYTSTHYIFPAVLAPTPPRHHVVESQLLIFTTAILADILVTIENLQLGQLSLLPGPLNKIAKPYDRRYFKNAIHGMKAAAPVLENLSFTSEEQNYSAAYPAYI